MWYQIEFKKKSTNQSENFKNSISNKQKQAENYKSWLCTNFNHNHNLFGIQITCISLVDHDCTFIIFLIKKEKKNPQK